MMNFFKLAAILLAYTIHCDSLETVENEIEPYDLKQHYCGELLGLALETVCINRVRNPVNDISEILEQVTNLRKHYRFLLNQCCFKQCSMNFIKENCPGNPKIPKCKDGSPATTITTTTLQPTTTTTPPPKTTTKTTITTTTRTQRYFELWSFIMPRPVMYSPLS